MAVDSLNKYEPFTPGFVVLGDRWDRWWVPGIILGRTQGHRRVIDVEGNHWFIDVEEQFSLTLPWRGKRQNMYAMSKI
ncbi:hypothetical protein D3C87_1020690 [compost metagenome]